MGISFPKKETSILQEREEGRCRRETVKRLKLPWFEKPSWLVLILSGLSIHDVLQKSPEDQQTPLGSGDRRASTPRSTSVSATEWEPPPKGMEECKSTGKKRLHTDSFYYLKHEYEK